MVQPIEALDSERARNELANVPSLLGAQRSCSLLYTIITNWRASLTLSPGSISSAMWAIAIVQGINRLATAGIVGATLGLIVQQNFGTGIHLEALPIGVASVTGTLLAARMIIGLIGAPIPDTLSDRIGNRWELFVVSLLIGA